MVRTLVIDDEALARRLVRHLLEQRSDVQIVGECRNGVEAIDAIVSKQPDLIFLDIQMKDMTGFEVLENIPAEAMPMVIFVTAYDQYAISAFDVFAFDYLLKPFKEDRFQLSVDKAVAALSRRQVTEPSQIQDLLDYLRQQSPPAPAQTTHRPQTLPIRGSGKITFVKLVDISHVEASGYYVEIHTPEKKYLLRETLTNLEQQLDPEHFIRIHRSTIVNLQFLSEIQHSGLNDVAVLLKTGRSFRVSKTYREGLFDRLGI